MRFNHWLWLAAGVAAFTLLALAAAFACTSSSGTPACAPDEPSITPTLTLAPHVPPRLVDQPMLVEVRLSNTGSGPAAILAPRDARQLLDRRAPLRLMMMDSSDTMFAPQAAGSTPQWQPVALFAGAFWGCDVNLLDLFGALAPDVYRLRLEYEVSEADAASMQNNPAPVWKGRAASDWQTFQVQSPDQARVVDEHARQWKASVHAGGDLRGLRWLAANTLEKGSAAARVTELLGSPTSIKRDAQGESWHYRVGLVGLEVRMQADRVTSIAFSER
jgi:hypothetical protein